MTPEEIKRLRDVCENATIGPWVNTMHGSNVVVETSINRHWLTEYNDPEDFKDAQFIAYARTAMPLLLDEVERLKAEQDSERVDFSQLISNIDNQLIRAVDENGRLREALSKADYRNSLSDTVEVIKERDCLKERVGKLRAVMEHVDKHDFPRSWWDGLLKVALADDDMENAK